MLSSYFQSLSDEQLAESYSRNLQSMMACDDPDAREKFDAIIAEKQRRVLALDPNSVSTRGAAMLELSRATADAAGPMRAFPVIPHESVPGVDCGGRLIIRPVGAEESELLCNECGALLLRGNSWILSDIVGLIPLIGRQANRRR